MTLFFQGELGAYSHLAANIMCPNQPVFGRPSFADVFSDLLKNPTNAIGIVPIENSIYGSVHGVFDQLQQHPVWITAEYKLRVSHRLLANPGATLETIKEVYSHPQALGQCETFFNENPQFIKKPWYDTAGSAKMVSENRSNLEIAAIAGSFCSEVYGLNSLKEHLESFSHNFTRFIQISAQKPTTFDGNKSSLIFETKNEPGALFRCLEVFASASIDLLKLESRPVWGKPWKHLFYLDFRGNFQDQQVQVAMTQLTKFTEFLKFFGSYPEDPVPEGHEWVL